LLRHLGLVDGVRQGRSIAYAVYDDHVAQLLDQAVCHAGHLRLGAPDLGIEYRDRRVCGAAMRPSTAPPQQGAAGGRQGP
jgi:hypothetical protein